MADLTPTHAGVAVQAADTGRILLQQRALDATDPWDVQGTWEFPGGGIDDGETPEAAAWREFREETGLPKPAGTLAATWTSPNGVYVGHHFLVPTEADAFRELNPDKAAAVVRNPDDPKRVNPDVTAWFSPDQARQLGPALRPEVARTDWSMFAPAAAAAPVLAAKESAEGGAVITSVLIREATTLAVQPADVPASGKPWSGRMRVRIIDAGAGSSGYYSPEVLKEAAAKGLITAGTPLYLDHPRRSDETDLPERSVRDIAGVFTGPAVYNPTTKSLEGEVQIFTPFRDLIREMGPHIGLSIQGSATDITHGPRPDGSVGPIVEGLAHINSVDFVTKAGRGGKVLQLLESAAAGLDPVSVALDEGDEAAITSLLAARRLAEAGGQLVHPGDTERLMSYWSHGTGAAKVAWGSDGDFDRCRAELGKYVQEPGELAGLCANLHHRATGAWPGHAPGETHSHGHKEAAMPEPDGANPLLEVSDASWNGDASNYSDAQWAHATVLDKGTDAGDTAKQRHALPVRTPSGAVNRNAVHAAAAVLAGGRGGVNASDAAKKSAASKLVGIYRDELKEDPPDSLLSLAGDAKESAAPFSAAVDPDHDDDNDTPAGKAAGEDPDDDTEESAAAAMAMKSEESTAAAAADDGSDAADDDGDSEDLDGTTSRDDAEQVGESAATSDTSISEVAPTDTDARPGVGTTPSPDKENTMTESNTQGAGADGRLAPQLFEAQLKAERRRNAVLESGQRAREIVEESLAGAYVLPSQARRLRRDLLAESALPLDDAGVLNEARLRTLAGDAIREAEEEFGEAAQRLGVGQVSGLGSFAAPAVESGSAEKRQGDLTQLFQSMGLSESAAKTAATRR